MKNCYLVKYFVIDFENKKLYLNGKIYQKMISI